MYLTIVLLFRIVRAQGAAPLYLLFANLQMG